MGLAPDSAERFAQSGDQASAAPGVGPNEPAVDVGEVMGQIARSLQQEHGDVAATLEAITAAAVDAVPGTDDCGVTLVIGRRHVQSRAPTGDLPRIIDLLQERLGEGPCIDAGWEHPIVRIDDMRTERRWPRFAAGAFDGGVRAMLSFRLFVAGDTLGALNLYSREPHALGAESESVGLLFASHAAIALAGAQNEERLRT